MVGYVCFYVERAEPRVRRNSLKQFHRRNFRFHIGYGKKRRRESAAATVVVADDKANDRVEEL